VEAVLFDVARRVVARAAGMARNRATASNAASADASEGHALSSSDRRVAPDEAGFSFKDTFMKNFAHPIASLAPFKHSFALAALMGATMLAASPLTARAGQADLHGGSGNAGDPGWRRGVRRER
jgi:hypothetical protein